MGKRSTKQLLPLRLLSKLTAAAAQYVVGLPLGALFCFVWGFGLQGLWSGLVIGSWFQICCFTYWLGRRMDWAGESKRARSRALKQKPKE